MKLGDAAFFESLGEVAGHIGTADFHPALLRLLECLVPCDYQALMLYSRHASPEYLINSGLPGHVVDLYLSGYYRFDPFHRYWRERARGGVVSLREAASPELTSSEYFTVFIPKSKITDDVGLFLPVAGGAALTPTLERIRGRYSPAELGRLRRIYPTVAGLHRAHVSRLFLSLAGDTAASASPETPRAVLVVDKDDRRVFTSRAWREAESKRADLEAGIAALKPHGRWDCELAGGGSLHVEPLDANFPLAPRGRIYVLEAGAPAPAGLDYEQAVERFLPEELTPREREIVRYILAGYPTEAIAKTLGIGRGTVKNHRARLYYKLDITTERELFSLFLEFLGTADAGGP